MKILIGNIQKSTINLRYFFVYILASFIGHFPYTLYYCVLHCTTVIITWLWRRDPCFLCSSGILLSAPLDPWPGRTACKWGLKARVSPPCDRRGVPSSYSWNVCYKMALLNLFTACTALGLVFGQVNIHLHSSLLCYLVSVGQSTLTTLVFRHWLFRHWM